MVYDDIVIGSGLSALGTVLGLPEGRRVLVVAGPSPGTSRYYAKSRTVPCAHLGYGGLGNYWHGVIPVGGREDFTSASADDFETLFRRFYPGEGVLNRIGKPFYFVPWRPIRPRAEWKRLASERGDRLHLLYESALRFSLNEDRVAVQCVTGDYRASRVWICAGAIHSPQLLDDSLGTRVSRETISDHVLCYVGQINRSLHPHVLPMPLQKTRNGIWFEAKYHKAGAGMFTLRPARFDYAQLDYGIEQRAVFGLPTTSAMGKIFRGASAGLMAEALYNRAGLFPDARMQSVYAQILVRDAHWLRGGEVPVEMRKDVIRRATDAVRADSPWPELYSSRRPEIFIPVIHLHHSMDLHALRSIGVNTPTAVIQVVDASVREHIGPEHHSFKLMLAAFVAAREIYNEPSP